MAQYLTCLGEIRMAIGDRAKARRVLLEAIRIDREVQALELALQVLDYAASSQSTKDYAGRLRSELEAQLTRQQVEAAQARAQARTFEAAVDEVLKQVESA